MTSSYGQPFTQKREYNPGITEESKKEAAKLQAEEDQKYSGSGFSQPKGAPNNSGGAANRINTAGETNQNQQPFETGMFNFASLMEDFYTNQPEEGDTLGQLQKSAYQGNLVQTAFDAQLASALATQNAGLAQENMTVQANLEKLNAMDLMQTEFGFNELSKESNFNYENSFANAQYDRDVGMLAATGEQQRDNIRETGNQDRLSTIVTGEQERLRDAQNNESQEKIKAGEFSSADYRSEVAADASKFGASEGRAASENVATTQAGASMYGADASERSSKFASQAAKDASIYGSDKQLEGVKDTNVTSTRNIRATGDETRTTLETENRLKAKDRADQSRYARGTARNF